MLMGSGVFIVVLPVVALAGAAAWWYWLRAPAPAPPSLSAGLTSGVVRTPQGDRRYASFIPAGCPPGAPILLVLHGSHGTAPQARVHTGFEFERLAQRDGFIVVYPEGYGGYWNDCRAKGRWESRRLQIDDVGFLVSLVELFRTDHGAGPAFFVGYSNGAQMCFRVAFEAPHIAEGVAIFAAGLPTPDNLVCPPPHQAISALLIDGTADPINPYEGGRVSIFGFGDRGTVYSAPESVEILAGLLGPEARRSESLQIVPVSPDYGTWVDRLEWTSATEEVALLTVHGGGHVVPQPHFRFPRILGPTDMRVNAPAECWAFFQRAIGRRAQGRSI